MECRYQLYLVGLPAYGPADIWLIVYILVWESIESLINLYSFQSFPEGDPEKAAKYTYGQAGVSYPRNVFEANFLGFANTTKMNLATMYKGKNKTIQQVNVRTGLGAAERWVLVYDYHAG